MRRLSTLLCALGTASALVLGAPPASDAATGQFEFRLDDSAPQTLTNPPSGRPIGVPLSNAARNLTDEDVVLFADPLCVGPGRWFLDPGEEFRGVLWWFQCVMFRPADRSGR